MMITARRDERRLRAEPQLQFKAQQAAVKYPRAVEVGNGQVLSQRVHVTVDPPLDAGTFDTAIPAGYHEARPDQD